MPYFLTVGRLQDEVTEGLCMLSLSTRMMLILDRELAAAAGNLCSTLPAIVCFTRQYQFRSC